MDLLTNLRTPSCLFCKCSKKITKELKRPKFVASALNKNCSETLGVDNDIHWPINEPMSQLGVTRGPGRINKTRVNLCRRIRVEGFQWIGVLQKHHFLVSDAGAQTPGGCYGAKHYFVPIKWNNVMCNYFKHLFKPIFCEGPKIIKIHWSITSTYILFIP